jgi:hypothetical protein
MTTSRGALSRKLAEVMAAVGRVPKNGWNDFHKYHYATEADIAEAIRSELATRSITLVPSVESYEVREIPSKKAEKDSRFVTFLSMTFTFEDGDTGERIEKKWLGAGEDSGDKGAYKAMTGAEKYFLLKTFIVPTGDDPESDGKKPQTKVKVETHAPASDTVRAVPEGSELIKKTEQLVTAADKAYWQLVLANGETVMTWKEAVGKAAEQACQDGVPVRLQVRGKYEEMGVVQHLTVATKPDSKTDMPSAAAIFNKTVPPAERAF